MSKHEIASEDKIAARVIETIAAQLELSRKEVQPEATFTEDLKADSLAVMELLLALEDTFDVQASDEEIDQMRTVQDAVQFVERQLAS
ncbi:MAG: acyl carrier protein [Deltaproteobacteria bacterium]|nr:acyl carrier protein [Deltaproteobacteria bacterium]